MNNITFQSYMQRVVLPVDNMKLPAEEQDYFRLESEEGSLFEVFDETLSGIGIKRGDFLEFDFNITEETVNKFTFCSGYYGSGISARNLFIISLSTGDRVARFIDFGDEGDFVLISPSNYPVIQVLPEEIDIVGKVCGVRRIKVV